MVSVDPARDRAVVLQQQLDDTVASLRPLAGADPDLHTRVHAVVQHEVARLRGRLDAVAFDVDPASTWAALTAVEESAGALAAEVLAFVGGLAVRRAGVDRGLSRLGAHLVETTGSAVRMPAEPVTIPAPSEYVNMMSGIIRVRFPGGTIWDLPVVLHEMGHFLAPRLGAGSPEGLLAQAFIDAERSTLRYLGNFADELFADCFATYVAGPAYVYTSLLERFTPAGAHDDRAPSHPAAVKRAEAMLHVLGHLRDHAGDDAPLIDMLMGDVEEAWRATLRTTGVDEEPDDEARAYARRVASAHLQALDAHAPAARYGAVSRAFTLSQALGGDAGQLPALQPDDTLLTVVNAGWIGRRRAEDKQHVHLVQVIAEQIAGLCAVAADGRQPTSGGQR